MRYDLFCDWSLTPKGDSAMSVEINEIVMVLLYNTPYDGTTYPPKSDTVHTSRAFDNNTILEFVHIELCIRAPR
jgi:hypothetical protein